MEIKAKAFKIETKRNEIIIDNYKPTSSLKPRTQSMAKLRVYQKS